MANKKTSIELTLSQWLVLSSIVYEVRSKLLWDKDCQSYTDGGDILISLDKDEYQSLMSIKL